MYNEINEADNAEEAANQPVTEGEAEGTNGTDGTDGQEGTEEATPDRERDNAQGMGERSEMRAMVNSGV